MFFHTLLRMNRKIQYIRFGVEERSQKSRRDQTKFHPTSPVPPPSRINEADVFQIREVTNAFFVRIP